MNNKITGAEAMRRYDCGNGNAQFCQGCYTMEPDEIGDYVKVEDLRGRLSVIRDSLNPTTLLSQLLMELDS